MEEFIERFKKLLGIETRILSPQESAAVEAGLYAICAAAIGMFSRWMQRMMAFNDDGLPDPSFWNFAIFAIALGVALIFTRRIDKMKNRRWFLTKNYVEVYSTDNKWLLAASNLGAVIMCLGGILLITETTNEQRQLFYICTGILGAATGIELVAVIHSARNARFRPKTLRLMSIIPMVFLSVWLICTYQANSINPLVINFGLQIITICILMMTVFRLAGIFFYSFKPSRTMFLCMFGSYVCSMNIPESIFFGETLLFIGIAVILICYTWIMICNMQERDAPGEYRIQDGFERLK